MLSRNLFIVRNCDKLVNLFIASALVTPIINTVNNKFREDNSKIYVFRATSAAMHVSQATHETTAIRCLASNSM